MPILQIIKKIWKLIKQKKIFDGIIDIIFDDPYLTEQKTQLLRDSFSRIRNKLRHIIYDCPNITIIYCYRNNSFTVIINEIITEKKIKAFKFGSGRKNYVIISKVVFLTRVLCCWIAKYFGKLIKRRIVFYISFDLQLQIGKKEEFS